MTEIPPSPTERPFFITHHAPDTEALTFTHFQEMCKDMKTVGFSEHRFDVRWNTSAPTAHTTNQEYLTRAARFAQIAQKEGLKPVVIFSTPPTWAYKGQSSEHIANAYANFTQNVKTVFDNADVSITAVQLLNEINNPVYTPKCFLSELPTMTAITKNVFGETTDVSATLVAAKPWTNVGRFVEKHKNSLLPLTSIGLDFYPGVYQFKKNTISPKGGGIIARQTLEAISTKGMKPARKDFIALLTDQLTNVDAFSQTIADVKKILPDANIDIGEMGFPTLLPLQQRNPDHEHLQGFALKRIADALKPVVEKHNIRKIGFYSLLDDREFGVLNWGMYNEKGEAKKVLTKLPEILHILQPRTLSAKISL